MKTLYCTLLACLLSAAAHAQNAYDSTLAKKLGADEYGMKKYVMVFLKTGSATNVPKSSSDSAFAGHMQNINRLVESGKLVVAGPFFKNDKYRGIFILNTDSIEEGRKLVETDPAVQAKLLDMDLLLWYGSAALAETLEIHKKIEKKSH
ncbi:YciI family protein [Dyadobacter fermentans]|uniref:YCII-related protein n=1 Tax=Dyadobacter fermentans (strain ATCC 700827 / DSM 18053 / CIP 107007 / KCTC 52180 / NS114) TaxID=471854 RepID=C6W5G5_DYAFD|nr:YciI family protein [Dyadobacter fermentans]ACT94183.1 YCII-related protein [Dyadobacter fermentans DSM 18053]